MRWLFLWLILVVVVPLAARASVQSDVTVVVRLGLRPPWTLAAAATWKLNGREEPAGHFLVQPNGSQVQVESADGGALACANELLVEGAAVNGRHYRGQLAFHADSVENVVGLQPYLYGVVSREIGGAAEPEALKAQAVVARTYTLAHLGSGQFTDDVRFQAYPGQDAETPAAVRAVDETAAQVLTFRGQLARFVCYHSTCGGHTESNENVFGTVPIPYLRAVECTIPPPDAPAREGVLLGLLQAGPTTAAACSASPYYRWSVTWPTGEAPDVTILEQTADGRVKQARIGNHVARGDAIRRLLTFHSQMLYSTAFTLERTDQGLRADGCGWGHGVGMCQWGARGMARSGALYDQILQHYFVGAQVTSEP